MIILSVEDIREYGAIEDECFVDMNIEIIQFGSRNSGGERDYKVV